MNENVTLQYDLHELQGNVAFRELTPETAREWLAGMRLNRTPSSKNLNKLVNDLQQGRFIYNGDPIRFDKQGRMGDGQHRCLAVLKTGITIPVLTVRNLPDEAFATIDVGAMRSPGAIITIMGYPNGNNIASAVRLRESIRVGTLAAPEGKVRANNNSNTDLSGTACLSMYLNEKEAYDKAIADGRHYGSYTKTRKALLQQSLVAALLLYLIKDKKHPEDVVHDFFKQLCLDIQPASYTIALLRVKITEAKSKDNIGKFHRHFIPNILAKGWNAYIEGRDIKILNWNPKEGTIEYR